jgi:hypothetical protein
MLCDLISSGITKSASLAKVNTGKRVTASNEKNFFINI